MSPMADELFFHSAAQLSAALATRRCSAVELMQTLIARTQALDSRVRAFNSFDAAGALEAGTRGGRTSGPRDRRGARSMVFPWG